MNNEFKVLNSQKEQYRILQTEYIENDTKILYHTELKILFSPNGLFCLKIDTSDSLYDKLILKNMSSNLIVWYLNINKKKDTLPILFYLDNYDLYLRYDNQSIIKIINNNYEGTVYSNLSKLELEDNGELK